MKANNINITQSILINCSKDKVFDYVSNYGKDKYWRKIIHETQVETSPIKVGALLTESSFLSKKYPNYITRFKCVSLEANQSVTCETTTDNLFWSKNTRSVEAFDKEQCKFTYHFELDSSIVKYAFGFSLPAFLIQFTTQLEMKSYLKALKKLLEQKS